MKRIDNLDYIPIDFVKLKVLGVNPENYLNNDQYEMIPKLQSYGEIQYWYTEKDNMKLIITESIPRVMILSGSIHKFITKGHHNHSDFTKKEFGNAVQKLKEVFDVLPNQLRILQLEFGFNITPPIDSREILRNIFIHKKSEFETPIRQKGFYRQVRHAHYFIKCYDKAKQYLLKEQKLRFEIKQINWSCYRSLGIVTLKDFIDSDKKMFLQFLIGKWREIVFFDPLIKKFEQSPYSNIKFWHQLIDTKNSNSKISYHRNKLKELNKLKGQDIQERIRDEFLLKANILSD